MAMTGGTPKLVKSGTPSGWPGSIKLYIYYTIKDQSLSNNTTTLLLGAYITTPSGYWLEAWADSRGSYVGTATSGTNCKSFDGSVPYKTQGTYWLTENQEVTVSHNADGTKTATLYWKWGVYSSWGGFTDPSGSFTVTLPAIPRESSLTAPTSWVLGAGQTITIGAKVTSYRHRLTYVVGAQSGTILDKSSTGLTPSWTPPFRLASENPNGTTLSGTITLETYASESAATAIGSVTKPISLTIPNNADTKPTVSATLTPVSGLAGGLASVYLQGISRVKADIAAAGMYGASIKTTKMTVDGASYGASDGYTSGYLSTYGNRTVTITATDSRGHSASASYTISVVPYARPIAKVTQCARCKSDGTLDDGGNYLRVTASKSSAPVIVNGTNQNGCKLYFRYRLASAPVSAFSEWITLLPASGGNNFDGVVTGVSFTEKSSFVIQFGAEDVVSGNNLGTSFTIPSEVIYWHRTEGGLALGMYANEGGLEVAWESNFVGNVRGMVLGLGGLPSIPEGSDLNDYVTPGAYSIRSHTIAATLKNIPEPMAGTVRVWNGTGSTTHTGPWRDLVQEYIVYTGDRRYVRDFHTEGTANQWVYGSWKALS